MPETPNETAGLSNTLIGVMTMKRILIAAALVLAVTPLALGQDGNRKPNPEEGEKQRLTNLVRYLMVSHTGSSEELLKKLDEGCVQAMVQGNIDTLEMLESDGFTFTSPEGTIMTKEQDLATIKSGDIVYDSITLDDVAVRVFGDAGVVTGRANVKGKYKKYDISGAYRYTVTFVKLKGRWQAVASQMTRVMS